MISLNQAYQSIIDSLKTLPTEEIELEKSLNRSLACDITSDIDLPSFNRVAMDGYACKREDLSRELKINETVLAGQLPKYPVNEGQCTKIMTGAVLPEGADCVFMVEYSKMCSEKSVRFIGEDTKDNISPKGELIKKGQVVLRKGTLLKPHHIAVAASVGQTKVTVYRKPRVGIIATGDELVPPSKFPGPSQLRNSNNIQIYTQVRQLNAMATDYGIAKDDEKSIESMIDKALKDNDIVLLSGGVSMGELDLVKLILKRKCSKILFKKISIKPGKPTVFGIHQDKYCVGLPGNPVSSYVIFELLITPLIYGLMGHNHTPSKIKMPLASPITIKNPDREKWLPIKLENGEISPLVYKGSAHSSSLNDATGLISVASGTKKVEKGTLVDVRQI